MSEIDDVLRQSFARIAEPGDPAGVADALRARMAAGDTGTPAASSGFASGAGWVLPWVFGGALLAIGGLLLGVSGILPSPFAAASSSDMQGQVQYTADALDCPGGTPVATLAAGNRVLAIARSHDSAYVAVRNPFATATTVWLPTSVVYPDAGEATVADLPVEACPVVEVSEADPTPTATPAPIETQAPGPVAPGDTSVPGIRSIGASPTLILNDETTTITVVAADNVAVTGVSVQISGAYTGTASMTKSGGNWVLSFSVADDNYYGDITFTARAVDAAGNQSAPSAVTVDHQYFG